MYIYKVLHHGKLRLGSNSLIIAAALGMPTGNNTGNRHKQSSKLNLIYSEFTVIITHKIVILC